MLELFIRLLDLLYRIIKRSIKSIKQMLQHDIVPLSSHVANMILLALFPFLLMTTALSSFFGNKVMAQQVVGLVVEMLPSDVAYTLAPAVQKLLGQHRLNLLTIGILISVWTASSSIEALRLVLNRAYGGVEKRTMFRKRLESIVMVILGAAVMLGATLLILEGTYYIKAVSNAIELSPRAKTQLTISRWIAASILLTCALTFLHRVLPAQRPRLKQVLPGVFATMLILMVGAIFISYYLIGMTNISLTYGSFAGVIITLLFFYLIGLSFGFGAEFNAASPNYQLKS